MPASTDVRAAVAQRAKALPEHQTADRAQEDDVRESDKEVDLACSLERVENDDARDRAEKAADQQYPAHLEIDGTVAEMREHPGDGGSNDLR